MNPLNTVGILGAGQLGLMLHQAATDLGIACRLYDPAHDACAARVAPVTHAPFEDHDAIHRFVTLSPRLDVLTLEFENVPADALRAAARTVPVAPAVAALEAAQDRLVERRTFAALGIPTPRFIAINTPAELPAAVDQLGLPCVLKTRRMGYDGKGQAILRDRSDLAHAWLHATGSSAPHPCILDQFVPFTRELSAVAARGFATSATTTLDRDGQHAQGNLHTDLAFAFYPLVQNHHHQGILRTTIAPAPNLHPSLQRTAESHARALLNELGYIGVLAIEFFEVPSPDGTPTLLANEFAPRVHNSGHWTIQGAHTSQFAQHLRAITRRPLGPTTPRGHARMLNCIGTMPDTAPLRSIPGVFIHDYGKAPRPGRKVGHITLLADTPEAADDLTRRVAHATDLPLPGPMP